MIRRTHGGHREKEDTATGQSLPLQWERGTSFPATWCDKRIRNGEEDTIWLKYEVLTSPAFDKTMRRP